MAISAIETVLWPGIKDDVGADASFGGIYADKPGYHNSRNRLRARGLTDDYSIQLPIDLIGPGDLGAALDITFRSAQAGSYSNIGKYSRRLYAAGVAKDSRCYPMREFFGNTNGDPVVDGWSYFRGWSVSSDSSHLWHIHISIHRKYINDPTAMRSILAVWRGDTEEDEDVALSDADIDRIAVAVLKRDNIIRNTFGGDPTTNTHVGMHTALAGLGSDTARIEQKLDALAASLRPVAADAAVDPEGEL